MARKVDEAISFVFVLLIEQEPGKYDKCHVDWTNRFGLGKKSHEMESGSWLSFFETI
jgi:hypothetical protein